MTRRSFQVSRKFVLYRPVQRFKVQKYKYKCQYINVERNVFKPKGTRMEKDKKIKKNQEITPNKSRKIRKKSIEIKKNQEKSGKIKIIKKILYNFLSDFPLDSNHIFKAKS